MSAVGLIGILVFFAGSHLLWQARGEIWFWLEEFFRILRGEFTRRHALPDASPPAAASKESRRKGALRLASGFALVFLGPVLFLLDLAF